jgi:hypothetical protein
VVTKRAQEEPDGDGQFPLSRRLNAVRREITLILDSRSLELKTAVALRSALRLLDAVAEHDAPGLHAEALRVALDAMENRYSRGT